MIDFISSTMYVVKNKNIKFKFLLHSILLKILYTIIKEVSYNFIEKVVFRSHVTITIFSFTHNLILNPVKLILLL